MVSRDANDPNAAAQLDAWAVRLRGVLENRRAILGELEAASVGQEALIEARDTTKLLQLLADRQRVVDRFVAGQAELLELTASLEERLAALPPAAAEPLRRGVREISSSLARVTAHDEEAHLRIRAARDEARSELQRANTGAGARNAYATTGIHQGPRTAFADRKG